MMPFVSYAINREDVLLYRVFRELGSGFYVDLGAKEPECGSTTKAFYDRGWRGINVIFSSGLASEWSLVRSRDINLPVDTSTQSPIDIQKMLNDVMSIKQMPTLQILRIDCAGGHLDWALNSYHMQQRPKIVLITNSSLLQNKDGVLVFQQWANKNSYQCKWDDSVNSIYVPAEISAALEHAFKYPPNQNDGFVSHQELSAQSKCDLMVHGFYKDQKNQLDELVVLNKQIKALQLSYNQLLISFREAEQAHSNAKNQLEQSTANPLAAIKFVLKPMLNKYRLMLQALRGKLLSAAHYCFVRVFSRNSLLKYKLLSLIETNKFLRSIFRSFFGRELPVTYVPQSLKARRLEFESSEVRQIYAELSTQFEHD